MFVIKKNVGGEVSRVDKQATDIYNRKVLIEKTFSPEEIEQIEQIQADGKRLILDDNNNIINDELLLEKEQFLQEINDARNVKDLIPILIQLINKLYEGI